MSDTSFIPVPGGRKLAEEWALLLASQAIECNVHVEEELGLGLVVETTDRALALEAIALYQSENAESGSPDTEPEEELAEPGFSGIAVAVGLFAIYTVFGSAEGGHPVFDAGRASSHQILNGEWWRTLTALFLHAHIGHIVGNALFGVYFITVVTRSFGDGFGLLLVLLAGAIGNGLNAVDQGPGHHSIGASTAVFGAIGILVGSALARRSRSGLRGARLIVPLGAGLGLMAMLGVGGIRTDIWAHAYGLLAGSVLGFGCALALPRRPSTTVQWVCGGIALAGIALAWKMALSEA
ncbi:MAG: rhomboid family intramembrane serine protease [Myxococcota bacterium]|nr:rhomboid family intramembrane serine protease [Myxococcota bacterium]